jgi:hypothetical protein
MHAACLTTNGRASDQEVWLAGSGATDKTQIRLTVEVPDADLASFRQVQQQYWIDPAVLKIIAPYNHRQHWYFALGGVRPDQITQVERRQGEDYHPLAPDQLAQLVAEIEAEIAEKLEVTPGSMTLVLKFPFLSSWLLNSSTR